MASAHDRVSHGRLLAARAIGSLRQSRGDFVERSLSVLLPVRNVQSTLIDSVLELLEVVPELTPRFELIIIDDGSTDATPEVAGDLAALYPQVQTAFHARSQGRAAAVRTGLGRSTGDVIFLRDEDCHLAADEIRKLWREVDDHPMVFGRPGVSRRTSRLIGWKRHGGERGLRMINRRAMRHLQASLDDQARLVGALARRAAQWHEVELHERPTAAPRGNGFSGRHEQPRGAATQSRLARAKRVGYLRSLRDFAFGE
jgi:glycosyltransferase involved in cell wall biosynthesis